ncbi:homeodomain-like superfamily protein [Actinidia rufa]|uniref:Homeodomain-like superfamily protein n=1 Tax=Actinidia rufa TaxID=165716 RepID=A0A7J0FKA9_9ERIC|nr:homeodomain-like superfamily protein [Actinidia rufa]
MPTPTNSSFLASFNSCLFSTIMADLEQYSSSDNASVDSREYSSQDSKLEFSEDEETLITRMYNLVGERWSLIAGRIPGRSAEEIEKYWTSRYSTSE